jgi:hypothetical protein
MKNRLVVLVAGLALAALQLFGATADGTWTVLGVQSGTGPATLVLQSNGANLTGTAGGVSITDGKISGNQIHFKTVENGTTVNYKGTVSGNRLNLHSSQNEGGNHRVVTFSRSN